jgi:hypothetical protein
MKRRRPCSRARLFAFGTLLVIALGCGAPEPDPRYRPTESVLEAVAVLHRHVADDTYRFPPAEDYTGRNVYRATLIRLENLERAYEAALEGGGLDDVIAFAKGRALERLRAFELAATSYRRAAERAGELAAEAERSAALCSDLSEAERLGESPEAADLPARLAALAARSARLDELLDQVGATYYRAVVEEELEHTQVARTHLLVATRALVPDGDLRALAALQQLVVDQRESKNANSHLMSLADLYAALAHEYVDAHPPAALDFDPPRFEELVDAAARLYGSVSNQDGAPEKLEAGQKLEAFIAFTLRVDRDRFTP